MTGGVPASGKRYTKTKQKEIKNPITTTMMESTIFSFFTSPSSPQTKLATPRNNSKKAIGYTDKCSIIYTLAELKTVIKRKNMICNIRPKKEKFNYKTPYS